MIIQRRLLSRILAGLTEATIILIEAPPRAGKTVLAGQILRALGSGALSLSVDGPGRAALIGDPLGTLEAFGPAGRTSPVASSKPSLRTRKIFILDDATREEASILVHGLEAEPREAAAGYGFCLIGGPFKELPRPTGGRDILRLELSPFSLTEVGVGSRGLHWLRGGFPEAFNTPNDQEALAWLRQYAGMLAEERFAAAGLPWAPGRTRALLAMLAEAHGAPFNENAAARSLGVSRPTVVRSIAALESAGIVRSLVPLRHPGGKRRLRAPALYIRDSGLFHGLLGIGSAEALLGSSRLAASWEGYAVEEIIRSLPPGLEAFRYRSQDGAGLELVITKGETILAACSIRFIRGIAPERGARSALSDLGLSEGWLVLPEAEERETEKNFRKIGLARFLERLPTLA